MRGGEGCVVYFIRRADDTGPVKIGCSRNAVQRLYGLMAWSPHPLKVVATIPGGESLECQFHTLLAAHHSHREWFNPTAEVEAVVAAVVAGTFDLGRLPKGRRLPSFKRVRSPEQRQQHSYRLRASGLLHRTGINTPREIVRLIDRFDRMSDAERAEAAPLIDAHFAAPLEKGSVLPVPWAQERYAKWAA